MDFIFPDKEFIMISPNQKFIKYVVTEQRDPKFHNTDFSATWVATF